MLNTTNTHHLFRPTNKDMQWLFALVAICHMLCYFQCIHIMYNEISLACPYIRKKHLKGQWIIFKRVFWTVKIMSITLCPTYHLFLNITMQLICLFIKVFCLYLSNTEIYLYPNQNWAAQFHLFSWSSFFATGFHLISSRELQIWWTASFFYTE